LNFTIDSESTHDFLLLESLQDSLFIVSNEFAKIELNIKTPN